MSSSEMFSLIIHLNLMIGQLVPEHNEHWELYLSSREIVMIVTSRNIHCTTHKLLETVIYEYLTLLKTLFPNSMKPKYHLLIHYPRCMLKFGPLIKLSCLRFESKNQEGKQASKSTTSVNINKTISIKHQLLLNYRFLQKEESSPIFQYKIGKKKAITHFNLYQHYVHLLDTSTLNDISSVKFVYYIDKMIKKNSIIVIFTENGPNFHRVHEIIFNKTKSVFITQKLNDCFLKYHVQEYKVYNLMGFSWNILSENDVTNGYITYLVELSDGHYISKHGFKKFLIKIFVIN